MSKYVNKFKINDILVSNWNYSYIPRGTTVRVVAITPTGSLKLDGIAGSYNPDKFTLACKNEASLQYVVDDKSVAEIVDSIEEAVEIVNTLVDDYGASRELIKVYTLGDEVDITPYISDVRTTQKVRIFGSASNNEIFYARRNIFAHSDSDRKLLFGYVKHFRKNDLQYYTRAEAEIFNIDEARELIRPYNNPDFIGWTGLLSLELIDT